MSKTTSKNIKERQSKMPSIHDTLAEALASIDNAETCETGEDFDANLGNAIFLLKLALVNIENVKNMP